MSNGFGNLFKAETNELAKEVKSLAKRVRALEEAQGQSDLNYLKSASERIERSLAAIALAIKPQGDMTKEEEDEVAAALSDLRATLAAKNS